MGQDAWPQAESPRYHLLRPYWKRQEAKELSRCSWILCKIIWSLCQCSLMLPLPLMEGPRQYHHMNASSQSLSPTPAIPRAFLNIFSVECYL